MFTTDRDLLVLEPGLFRDVGWVAQRLTKGSGTISGNTLTITGADVSLDAPGIAAGHVVTVGGTSYEVIARQSPTALTVSRTRANSTDAILPPSPASAADTVVMTFAPQIAIVERQVLRMAGIEPEDTTPGIVTASAITNPSALTMLIALGALHVIYAAAGASSGASGWLADRASMYRERFAAARQNARVLIDLDGDGIPDAARRLNVALFVRG